MSTRGNGSSFSGGEEPTVTGNSGSETSSEKPNTADQSQRRLHNSPKEQKAFSLTLEEYLPIFQEDLRILRDLGVKWKIVPRFGPGYCAVVFENIEYRDGDFVPTKPVTGSDEPATD